MSKKTAKTNGARILDALGIGYELLTYEVDEANLGAENVCAKLGMSLDHSVKTLVLRGDKKGILVACMPGSGEIDLKKLAILSGNKKIEMVPVKEVLSLTGYIRGGVSPLGMKKNYPIFMEERLIEADQIIVSAGLRGVQLKMALKDLVGAISPTLGDLMKE